jgi:CRISPR-associated protein Csx10
MKYLDLTITAQAPISIGQQKFGSISETEYYIPGAAIRGAIATYLLRQTGHTQTDLSAEGGDFQALFLDQQAAIFRNAYPAIAKINDSQAEAVEEPIWVLPATAVSSKNDPGFKQANSDKGGVFDTLIDRFCADQYSYPYDPSCPKDRSRVEPLSGFYSKSNVAKTEYPYRSHSVSTRFLTRVGINRRRATAQDNLLYSIEVLNESFLPDINNRFRRWEYVEYRGQVIVDDDNLANQLMQMINHHSGSFRIGGSASRGLGQVYLQAKESSTGEPLSDRIQQFNHHLQERWQRWENLFGHGQEIELERTFFTLDLQADAILTDCWRRTTVITPVMLKTFVGLPADSDLQLHTTYSSYNYRGGWNAALGLMKDVELVTNKGAIYLFSVPSEQRENWLSALKELEAKGVGDRTSEGFGQVQICNEFHTIFRESAV